MKEKIFLLLFSIMFLITFLAPVSAQEEPPTYRVEITINIAESIQFRYIVVIPSPDQADDVRNNFASGVITQDEVENTIIVRIEEGVGANLRDVEFEVRNMDNWGTDLVYELRGKAENDVRSSGEFNYITLVPPWENTAVKINLPSKVISAGPQIESVDVKIEGNSVYYGFSEPGLYVLKVAFKVPSSISISASPSTFSVGGSTTLSGFISPAHSGTVTLEYSMAGGAWSILATPTAQTDGSYSYSWKPDKAGEYEVRTLWQGDADHEGAMSPVQTITVEEKRCIIATAAYGSELNQNVQFLREFREDAVLTTFAGSQFMKVFNAWYYSFSPTVAGFIADNPPIKEVMKTVLYPLAGILHLSTVVQSAFSFNSELGVVMAGFVASALIGAVYFSPLTVIPLLAIKRLGKRIPEFNQLRLLLVPWVASLVLIVLGEISVSPNLLMIASGAFVIFTVSLFGGAVALKLARA